MRKQLFPALILGAFALSACGGGIPGIPGAPSTRANPTEVNPSGCGSYASTDAGAKLKAFLTATVAMEKAVLETEEEFKETCVVMAKELGVSEEGDTATVCKAVSEAIKEHLSVGLKAGAALTINYEPPVCTIDASAAASAAASCEGKASSDINVNCQGTCQGTCNGECQGSTGSGGECEGVCKGTCDGTCQGYADVDASVECEASAEIKASVEAKCSKPSLEVDFAADVVVDRSKVDAVKAALMAGMPTILTLQARAKGPLVGAAKTWAKSAVNLADSTVKIARAVKNEAKCISGQLAGAAKMVADIEASIEVQVEVSASISGSASAEGAAGS